jgi:peptidoglycan hydrolase-like protein with peptidoglycan-binding domain
MPGRVARAGALAALVVAGGGAAWGAGLLPPRSAATAASAPPAAGTTTPPQTAAIERRTLTVTEDLAGTLGYEGSLAVPGQLAGTVTWLPAAGSVIGRGGRLYETDGRARAILMIGRRPAWRAMSRGVADGADVAQLEANLKALGYAVKGLKVDGRWDAKTTASVKRWQKAAHLPVDGVVDLGEVVYLPTSVRVTGTDASLGAQSGGGAPVLHGSGPSRVVTVALEADRQDLLKAGAAVSVALPDGTAAGGHVRSVGRVAHAGESNGMGGTSPATIDVAITLDTQTAGSALDGAPVTVHVVTAAHQNVLAVPVRALVALLEGGYAVEIQAADGSRRYVGVTLGLFQDGRVEIEGAGLSAGDKVVVAS